MTSPLAVTEDDILVWARTVYGEARGEPYAGKVAVAWSIRNRVEIDLWNDKKPDWWGEGIEGVCKRPGQYDCWRDKDPNRARIENCGWGWKLAEGGRRYATNLNDPAWRECVAIVLEVAAGRIPDPTSHSTHYYNPDLVKEPPWAKGKTGIRIGAHLFFKPEPGDV